MTFAELEALYNLPFFDLLKRAREVHDEHWKDGKVQLCTLLSIKTGGCSEDCSYCSQSVTCSKRASLFGRCATPLSKLVPFRYWNSITSVGRIHATQFQRNRPLPSAYSRSATYEILCVYTEAVNPSLLTNIALGIHNRPDGYEFLRTEMAAR